MVSYSFTTFVALSLSSIFLLSTSLDQCDAKNTDKFYITEPACDFQGCTVSVHPDSTLRINWLNPINGKIDISLAPEAHQRNGKSLSTVKIASGIAANNRRNECQTYDGAKSCGLFEWKVPATIKPGNYSVDIHSLYRKSVHGYSDIIAVAKAAPSTAKNSTAAATPVAASNSKRAEPKQAKGKKDEAAKKHHHHKNQTEPADTKHHDDGKAKKTAKEHKDKKGKKSDATKGKGSEHKKANETTTDDHHRHHHKTSDEKGATERSETAESKPKKDGKKASDKAGLKHHKHHKNETTSHDDKKHEKHHKNETTPHVDKKHKKHSKNETSHDGSETKKHKHHKHGDKSKSSGKKTKRMSTVALF